MRKYTYIAFMLLLFCLLGKKQAFANSYTPRVYSQYYQLSTGENIRLLGQTYNWLNPVTVDTSGTTTILNYEVEQNLQITGMTRGKYYNGYINCVITMSPEWFTSTQTSTIHVGIPELLTTQPAEGVYIYLWANNTANQYTITVQFNNFYNNRDSWFGLPSILLRFSSIVYGTITQHYIKVPVTLDLSSVTTGNLHSSDGPEVLDPALETQLEEINNNFETNEEQANSIAAELENVSLPEISSGNLNILGTVDSTQKNNFFTMLSIITHTELVTKIMLIIVIGSLVGFILYGKKGG